MGAARLTRLARYDLVLVDGVLERLPARAGAELIARLRDVHARRLLVLVPEAACPRPARLRVAGAGSLAGRGETRV